MLPLPECWLCGASDEDTLAVYEAETGMRGWACADEKACYARRMCNADRIIERARRKLSGRSGRHSQSKGD